MVEHSDSALTLHRQLPIAELLRGHSVLALPIGAALSLAFAPFGVWPLAVVCLALLFHAWDGAGPRQAAKVGFYFTAGTFLSGTYWLYHTLYIIGHVPLVLAILLMLALVAIMGGYTALLGYAQARWLPRDGLLRCALALPAAWTALEWFRGWFLSGFPWLSIGYSQIDSPLAGFAPLMGVYGVTFLTACSAACLAGTLCMRARQRWLALVIAALPWLSGWMLWHHEWTQRHGEPISVAIVQGAVRQDLKWSVEQRDRTLALYRDLTQPYLGRQLIVWPEAALPDLADQLTGYITSLWQTARAAKSDVIMGVLRYEPSNDGVYNSVVALSDGAQWYDKRRLVPFGEFFPVPSFVRQWMKLMSLPYSDITPGAPDQPPLHAAGQMVTITVCYEDSYGNQQRSVLDRATLLVNVTNDAWFGDSTAPHQHLEISRMRALEAGRPLVRAANDGISALISSNGSVISTLPQFQAAVLTGTVQPRTGLTFYARCGDALIICICGALLLLAIIVRRRHT